jgi:PhzF family phenazine biosynthesis protein
MTVRRFIQCDVFSPTPTLGNALAVVVDGDGLTDEQMTRFAAWTNLAETTFLMTPEDPNADYKVRIFTPAREMPFAGHPTLGSCASWLHAGGRPRDPRVVRQECGVGIIDVHVDDAGELAFAAPPTRIQSMDPVHLDDIVETLDIPGEEILRTTRLDNGPVWQILELSSAEAVRAVDSFRVRWPTFKSIGLLGALEPDNECDYEVRMLAPSSGMSEDPITGSLNSAIACWMHAEGRLPGPLTVSQGGCIGRHGRVSIRPVDGGDEIHIGGATSILIEGTVDL